MSDALVQRLAQGNTSTRASPSFCFADPLSQIHGQTHESPSVCFYPVLIGSGSSIPGSTTQCFCDALHVSVCSNSHPTQQALPWLLQDLQQCLHRAQPSKARRGNGCILSCSDDNGSREKPSPRRTRPTVKEEELLTHQTTSHPLQPPLFESNYCPSWGCLRTQCFSTAKLLTIDLYAAALRLFPI